jgi:hypothetical protein
MIRTNAATGPAISWASGSSVANYIRAAMAGETRPMRHAG